MNITHENDKRVTTAKSRLSQHLQMVMWLLLAAAIAEWRRWSAMSAGDYEPDLSRFMALAPLALLGLLYLWDAVGPGSGGLTSGLRSKVPSWVWVILIAAGTLLSLLPG